ncbi:unnamed protein product, partial [Meganyctiphanes norvegica]
MSSEKSFDRFCRFPTVACKPHYRRGITIRTQGAIKATCRWPLATRGLQMILWASQGGHDVYSCNMMNASSVPLLTQNPNVLTWYTCGPTVYDSAHIGHALCYVKLDIIRRILVSMFDLNVVMVMGITDIDDKIINRANEVILVRDETCTLLGNDTLNDLVEIKINGSSVSDFIPEAAILHWFDKGTGNKKLGYMFHHNNIHKQTNAYDRY